MITLKKHQLKAVEWLQKHNWRSLIYGDPGVGKSFIALEALRQSGARTALILTVASCIKQWQKEIERFGLMDCSIIVSNYEKLLCSSPPFSCSFDAVIADECEKIKNAQSKTYRRFIQLQSPIRLALSGTPFPNGLYEAFSLINWFSPGLLGKNFYSFRANWCKTNPFIPQQIIGYKNESELVKIIQLYYFRITDEVLNLPEAQREIKWLELSPEEKKIYQTIHKESCIRLLQGGILTIPNILTEITRLVQFINDPSVFGFSKENTKYKILKELLPELSGKVIIFSELASVCKRLHSQFGGALLIGELSQKRRAEEIERFKNNEDCRFLWSSAAGSLGLNLTVSKVIIHFTLFWHNARIRQRLGRIRRIGQEKQTKEIFLIAKDTIEEKIWSIIERKKNLELKLSCRDYKEIMEI